MLVVEGDKGPPHHGDVISPLPLLHGYAAEKQNKGGSLLGARRR